MKDKIIASILLIIMLLNATDVFVDFGLNVPVWHIVQESFLVLLSAIGFVWLVVDMRKRTVSLHTLAHELTQATKQINTLHNTMARERKQYSEVIKGQFEQWSLTSVEQEVGFLLLKGLSLREIASVRNTKEATVRQQASNLYSKSNLMGRHEFSAWFFEDFCM